MNLYKFINVVYPGKIRYNKKILSNKLSFNILHSRILKMIMMKKLLNILIYIKRIDILYRKI